MTKVFITADIPAGLEQAWLQHVRNFDVAHPGCHFEIAQDAPNMTIMEAVEKLRIYPGLTFAEVFERGPDKGGKS